MAAKVARIADPERLAAESRDSAIPPLAAEQLFRAMTSHEISRNKHYSSFAYEGFRRVHRRYRVVRALQREADRLAGIPGSLCRVRTQEGILQVRLESPTLQYRREVALLPYEWEWLGEQKGIRSLLAAAAVQSAGSMDWLVP